MSDRETPRDRNIAFLEEYKAAERFINDAYQTREGLKYYQQLMDEQDASVSRAVFGWERDYKKMKRVRWIRNQFSHEVSYDTDICDESDYEWICSFHERLLKAEDPLANQRKIQKHQDELKKEYYRKRAADPKPTYYAGNRKESKGGSGYVGILLLLLGAAVIAGLVIFHIV